ncbi:MAG: ferritin-like domain-containing protein [Chitinophagaceae bacterium]
MRLPTVNFLKLLLLLQPQLKLSLDLEVDFSSINFASRASVLGTAMAFEDLGVSAYNGAGQLIIYNR